MTFHRVICPDCRGWGSRHRTTPHRCPRCRGKGLTR